MAKMFYSLEEAAARLKKSPDQVRQMASKGQLTEFRDGDRLIFKVDQVDLLAGDEEHDASEMSSMIPLADTGAGTALGMTGLGLADSAAGSASSRAGVESPKEKSGIPVFEADELELADPSAVTQVTETALEGAGLQVENLSGSGSGLMDLTRESDDTSLGAQGLMDELYPSEEGTAGATVAEESSGLFEGQAAAADIAGPEAPVAAGPVEEYDGVGSGLTGGLALGALAALGMAVVIVVMSMSGLSPGFVSSLGGELAPLAWMGIFAGATAVFAGVGFVLGKKSA